MSYFLLCLLDDVSIYKLYFFLFKLFQFLVDHLVLLFDSHFIHFIILRWLCFNFILNVLFFSSIPVLISFFNFLQLFCSLPFSKLPHLEKLFLCFLGSLSLIFRTAQLQLGQTPLRIQSHAFLEHLPPHILRLMPPNLLKPHGLEHPPLLLKQLPLLLHPPPPELLVLLLLVDLLELPQQLQPFHFLVGVRLHFVPDAGVLSHRLDALEDAAAILQALPLFLLLDLGVQQQQGAALVRHLLLQFQFLEEFQTVGLQFQFADGVQAGCGWVDGGG